MNPPCQNCSRIHYGNCRNRPRVCWSCGDLGHIQRHCRTRRRRNNGRQRIEPNRPQGPPGVLAPGSKDWCLALGIEQDPHLQRDILSTLRSQPGSTIYLNDECIYRGNHSYFYSHRLTDRKPLVDRVTRTLASRITRRRSRSPSRERRQIRSRSTLETYDRSNSFVNVDQEIRLASPEAENMFRESRVTPTGLISSSNSRCGFEGTSPSRLPPAPISTSPLKHDIQLSRPPLAARSGNVPRTLQVENETQAVTKLNDRANEELFVEDPHFVLGIDRGALEIE